MTTFVLAPTPNAVLRSPADMLAAGELKAYTQRANGTMRHMDLAPLGSVRRDTAEWISERLEDGATLRAVARELHISVPTVRRMIMSLELTEEIEAGDWDGIWDAPDADAVVGTEITETEYAAMTTDRTPTGSEPVDPATAALWADADCTCAAEYLGSALHETGCGKAEVVQA